MRYIRSQEDLEERVVGLEFSQLVVVPQSPLLESSLILWFAETDSDQALSGGRVELLGSIEEDDVLILWVDDDL